MEGTVLSLGCALPLLPLLLGRALLLLLLLLHPLPLFLLLLHLVSMIHGLGLLRHLLLIRGHPGGLHLQPRPGLQTQARHLVRGPRSPIRHLSRDQLMTSPRICLLLLLSSVPSSIAAPLQAIQIEVPRKCTARHIMIFQLLLQNPELRDSMRLVQQYSLEPFMTSRLFFYPWVVIEFYHTMTSKRVPHPTVIHFSIDGHEGTLQATDIAAAFHFPAVLANSTDYKLWSHPLPREMVRILSRDVTVGSILFWRQLPPSMLLIDHVLQCNVFPLQHTIQRR